MTLTEMEREYSELGKKIRRMKKEAAVKVKTERIIVDKNRYGYVLLKFSQFPENSRARTILAAEDYVEMCKYIEEFERELADIKQQLMRITE